MSTTSTSADGSYSFGTLLEGSYTITPSAVGYAFNPASFAVDVGAAGGAAGVDFTAIRAPLIHGRVTDLAGRPLAGVAISRLNQNAPTAAAVTNNSGFYAFEAVSPGVYGVGPQAGDLLFSPPYATATVTAAATTPADVSFIATSSIQLPAGLSMISLPFDYSDSAADSLALLGAIHLGNDGTAGIAAWDPLANQYLLYPDLPGGNGRQTVPGRGYWIREMSSPTLPVQGQTVASPFSVLLQPGWNQIGDPFLTPQDVASLQVGFSQPEVGPNLVPGPLQSLSFPAAAARGIVGPNVWAYVPDRGIYVPSSRIFPFTGYWVYVTPGAAAGPVTVIFVLPQA